MNASVLNHGSPDPLPQYTELRAGSLTVMYESGFIRYIRNGGYEIVRVINHYLRDQYWNTIPMRIEHEEINSSADSFQITYQATINLNDIDFTWHCSIRGLPDETIQFDIQGEAHSDFLRNRLGFTVLLPAAVLRDQTCRITHSDQSTTELLFPDKISPHQPFLDIQSMAWSPGPGLQAVVTFQGDVFEMEDQRNWMDASHKVYCTPLKLGFPKKVKNGERVTQSVHVKVFGDLHRDLRTTDAVTFTIDEQQGKRMPSIGIPLSEGSVTAQQRQYMADLHPDFISVVIKSLDDVALRIPKALDFGLPLELMLFPGSLKPDELVSALKTYARHIVRVILLVEGKKAADQKLVDDYVPALRKLLPKAAIGSGTDAFFTELNRNPTPADTLDFLSFTVNPQAHASDLRTMTENLSAHSDVVASCRALSGGRDVRVGPVTLKMRWNPDARVQERPVPGALPANVDIRQLSLYGAGWLLGSLKYLTESEAKIATFFEMAGWRGLMAHPDQPWPSQFGVTAEQAYPVFIMLRLLLKHRSLPVLSLISSDSLRLDGMAFREERNVLVYLANYSGEVMNVQVPPGLVGAQGFVVGAGNVSDWLGRPLDNPPFSTLIGNTMAIPPFGFAGLSHTM